MRLNFRARLVISFAAVMALIGLISAAAGLRLIAGIFLDDMYKRVSLDLNSARAVYDQHLRDVERTVHFTSQRFLLTEGSAATIDRRAQRELARVKDAESLDMLMLVGRDGRVLFRAGQGLPAGDTQAGNALVRAVLRGADAAQGTILMSTEELSRSGSELARRATIPLIDTPGALRTDQRETSAGLVLAAAARVSDSRGRPLGVLFGGRLLSRDSRMVDSIKQMLYQGLQHRGRDVGVVTLFQDDIRVATTLPGPADGRAVGTRGSAQALSRARTRSGPSMERADVIGDWYVTAYEPIHDPEGRHIGSLWVGVLESRYTDVRKQVLLVFLGVVAVGMAAALLAGWWLSGLITRPLMRLTVAARRLASGELGARARIDSKDEFGSLGAAFDRMARSIEDNERKVRQEAARQMESSERLAIVGQLAAGVAHEVNNPLGGILVYSHLLLDDTPKDDPRRANLEKIAQETARCRDIVRALLDFSRRGELQVEDARLNPLIDQALDLAKTQKTFREVRIIKRYAEDIPPLPLDRGKIQQVLLNVLFNAAEAMEGRGGTMSIATRLAKGRDRVEVRVRDTGCGMAPEVLAKVFQPFFTTKEVGKGVGLGLAVSYGIIEQHGGHIEVHSRLGHGTIVRILLPIGCSLASRGEA